MQRLQNFADLGIKFPHPGFGEMRISDFEKSVAIQFVHRRRYSIDDLIHQFTPPAFIVVLARPIDRWAGRHLLPRNGESSIERRRVQFQSEPISDECVMMTDALGQMKQCAHGVEKERFNHRQEL